MSETTQQFIEFGKIIWLALFSLFYGLGGINNKWLRRYVGSILLTGGFCLFAYLYGKFSYWYLSCFFLYLLVLSTGYGVNSKLMRLTKSKILTRIIYGILLALCSFLVAWLNSQWLMFGLHILICGIIVGVLGSQNPVKARSEETAIAVTSGFLPLFMI